MNPNRRRVLATIAVTGIAGCLSEGEGTTPTTTPDLERCDPADVTRPPIVRDTDHPPQGYGTKPMELTEFSVADYLADFETGFAWNRILQEHSDVTSLGVNTVDGYTPETVEGGFLASSRIETHYTMGEDHELTEREYVTNYFVAEDPVYRVETESDSVDPRSHPERQLVQCGPE